MKFYDRATELKKLTEMRISAFTDHSKLTVVTGRRRVGKTSLITHDTGAEPMVFFFVGRKNEVALCSGFCKEIEAKLGVFVPKMQSFEEIFAYLMQLGKSMKFTLIIDEFQEFFNINPSIYSDIQNLWDHYRLTSNVNLIVSGSIYSLMTKIFKDNREPLFGRADAMMKLSAFSTDVLKEILHDHNPQYTPDDLLCFYMVTGGVAKYAELMIDNKATSVERIIEAVCDPDSPLRDEGRNILIEEFGKNYGTYFSILEAISSGKNTNEQIAAHLGDKSIGGQLTRLEETYEVIIKDRPIFSKPRTQTVRYRIKDRFLEFWFRYFERNRALIEMGLREALQQLILADYNSFSGKVLEKYFIQKLKESKKYREISSYWEAKKGKEANEIDIVAISIDGKEAFVAEVKRQAKEFKPEQFAAKVAHLRDKHLAAYEISSACITLEDI